MFFVVALLCLNVQLGIAQEKTTLKGTVQDQNGKPVAKATVTITPNEAKDQKAIQTLTDDAGIFMANNLIVGAKYTIKASAVGYEPQTLNAFLINKNQNSVLINVSEATNSLDQVVVIGYGSVKKTQLTGAVSSVDSKDLDLNVASNFTQALQGKAAGVQVTQSTGQPGAGANIQIRSNPSNANGGVLYVIDGIIVNDSAPGVSSAKYGSGGSDQSPLNFINPNDIENISLLKDASATSIYGARAAAGVVLITTKKGKSGKPSINYSGTYGIQNVTKMYPTLSAREYMQVTNETRKEIWLRNNKIAPYYGTVSESSVAANYPVPFSAQQIQNAVDNNANDAITQKGYTQQQNLSISGGNDKTKYLISGNYFDQKGILINSGYQRYNGRINFDQKISDKISMGTNIILSNSITKNIITGGLYEAGGMLTAALYFPPNLPLQNPDGTYTSNPTYGAIPNPLSYREIDDKTNYKRILASAYANWEIIPNLVLNGKVSYDQSSNQRNSFYPTSFLYGAQVGGLASINTSNGTSRLSELTLNYKFNLGADHNLTALAGYSYQKIFNDMVGAGNQNFVSDAISFNNLGIGQADKPLVSSGKNEKTWASYFTRFSYSYKNKYTLNATIRRDGSSVFAENKKWGLFPSVSANWVITNEEFLKDNPTINFLTLRTGYGESGNSNFPATAFAVYNTATSPYFGTNGVSTGITLTQAANPNLTWETAGELNFGLDFGLLNNRVTGSLDYFNKTIRNIISQVPFPTDFTVSSVYANAGKTKSIGYEIGIQTKNVVSTQNKFTWSTNITFSHYLNYWKERSASALAQLPRYIDPSGKNALFNGQYGYVSQGIFKGQFGTAPATMPNMLPGGIILKDIAGYDKANNLTGPDGIITSADQTLLGNLDPKFNFGFGNIFTYKNFELNVFMSGQVKKAISPYLFYGVPNIEGTLISYGWNTMPVVLDRWTSNNPTANFPTGLSDNAYGGYQNGSDYYFVDASFIRCRNITLGYTINPNWLKNQNVVNGIKLSFDVQNAFTITRYPGIDPELNIQNLYPLSRSFIFGIQLSL